MKGDEESDENSSASSIHELDLRKDWIDQQRYVKIMEQAASIWDDFTSGKKKIPQEDDNQVKRN